MYKSDAQTFDTFSTVPMSPRSLFLKDKRMPQSPKLTPNRVAQSPRLVPRGHASSASYRSTPYSQHAHNFVNKMDSVTPLMGSGVPATYNSSLGSMLSKPVSRTPFKPSTENQQRGTYKAPQVTDSQARSYKAPHSFENYKAPPGRRVPANVDSTQAFRLNQPQTSQQPKRSYRPEARAAPRSPVPEKRTPTYRVAPRSSVADKRTPTYRVAPLTPATGQPNSIYRAASFSPQEQPNSIYRAASFTPQEQPNYRAASFIRQEQQPNYRAASFIRQEQQPTSNYRFAPVDSLPRSMSAAADTDMASSVKRLMSNIQASKEAEERAKEQANEHEKLRNLTAGFSKKTSIKKNLWEPKKKDRSREETSLQLESKSNRPSKNNTDLWDRLKKEGQKEPKKNNTDAQKEPKKTEEREEFSELDHEKMRSLTQSFRPRAPVQKQLHEETLSPTDRTLKDFFVFERRSTKTSTSSSSGQTEEF